MRTLILTLLILTALPISLPAQTICVYEIDSTFWPAGTCRPGPGLACWISPIDEWIVDTNAHWFMVPDFPILYWNGLTATLSATPDTVYIHDTVYAKPPCEIEWEYRLIQRYMGIDTTYEWRRDTTDIGYGYKTGETRMRKE